MSAPSAQRSGSDRQPTAERRGTRDTARVAGMIALAALFVVFALLNLNEVKVDWIIGSGRAPLIIVIVISLLVGIVLTYSAERLGRRKRRP